MLMEASLLGALRSSASSGSHWNISPILILWLYSGLWNDGGLTFSLDFRRRKEVKMCANATQRNKTTMMAARHSGPMLLDHSFLSAIMSLRYRHLWDTKDFSDCCSLFKKFCSSITDAFLLPLRLYLCKNWLEFHIFLSRAKLFVETASHLYFWPTHPQEIRQIFA